MRIVDDKGRLFGLVNLIDLLVITLIGVLAFSMISNPLLKAKARNKDSVKAHVKVLFTGVPDEIANSKKVLQTGDLVLGGRGVVEGILYKRPVMHSGDRMSGYSDLSILLKADCVELDGELYCANMPIKINSLCTISNPVYTFRDGVILDVEVEK